MNKCNHNDDVYDKFINTVQEMEKVAGPKPISPKPKKILTM